MDPFLSDARSGGTAEECVAMRREIIHTIILYFLFIYIFFAFIVHRIRSRMISVVFFSHWSYRSELRLFLTIWTWLWKFICRIYLSNCINYRLILNAGCSVLSMDRTILLCVRNMLQRYMYMYFFFFLFFLAEESRWKENRVHVRASFISLFSEGE